MIIGQILKDALERNASDVILTSDTFPVFKIFGHTRYQEEYWILDQKELQQQILGLMNEQQRDTFKRDLELDFGIDLKNHSRFRVNVFSEKKWLWIVFRPIANKVASFEDLWLPEQVLDFTKKKHGLVLVTGSVWSWKSTTLTSLIETINNHKHKHIITVEDPIEYTFKNEQSIIEQREVWTHTRSFENGLKYALRQASDVIMIWEMRDLETFRLALRAAETGNLVFATLHTSGAARTVSRVIDMFPPEEKEQIRSQLADSLVWVIWQELLERKDRDGRVLASELLVNTTSVSNMIRKDTPHLIQWAIETWAGDWMVTMKRSLQNLKERWLID